MHVARRLAFLMAVSILLAGSFAAGAEKTGSAKVLLDVPNQRLLVSTAGGKGYLPLWAVIQGRSVDLALVHPEVTRAVVVIHGGSRNSGRTEGIVDRAIHDSGERNWNTLLIAPAFLNEIDAAINRLPEEDLRWKQGAWQDGENARNLPVSSFDGLDAILERLSNHILLPNLRTVVLVGAGGGGLMVQHYAVIGRGGDALVHHGIRLRYVIVQPSSYLYFSSERPVLESTGVFDFAIPARECSGDNNRWRYGVADPPPYAADADFAAMEQKYIRREVIYLLGTETLDPKESSFDPSCAGEDQGPNRFYRGKAYFRYLENRHPQLAAESASQQLWYVPGVGSDSYKMLTSDCGTAALFDTGVCATRTLDPRP